MLMKRACASVLATIIGLIGVRQAIGEKLCRPELTINEVEFSDVMPPTLERIWSAVVSVNASACTENSKGYFDIVFTRLSENAPDLEFRKRFIWSAPSFVWQAPSVSVGLTFAANIGSKTSRRANVETNRPTILRQPIIRGQSARSFSLTKQQHGAGSQ